MTSDQATFLRDFLVKAIQNEYPTTRSVIAAVPDAKSDYRPDPKSMTALELSWHIIDAEFLFLKGIATGAFTATEPTVNTTKNIAEMLEVYDAGFSEGITKVRDLNADDLTRSISFFDIFNYPAVEYLNFLLQHSIHHRGQLSKYLRPMGSKVPPIYGPSADA
jgi:uncharacterized damage-inducible protein DinB